jgi:hypothetical protein
MRTITLKVFSFDELEPRAKERARNWYREASSGDEWWEVIYEDAKNVGIEILGFDCGRRDEIDLRPRKSWIDVAKNIVREHGKGADTYGYASAFLEAIYADLDYGELVQKFKDDVGRSYLDLLRKESEYTDSDEYIDEQIRLNEYEFYADGTFVCD